MRYVGLQTQIWRNNRNTVILLCMFPVILLGMVLLAIMTLDFFGWFCWDGACPPGPQAATFHWPIIWYYFKDAMPFTLSMTGLWFIIAYCTNTAIIRHITHAKPTERKDNLRVYNLVENLCIAGGIEMPQINIVEDDQLNAFASGIDKKRYTVTLTTGIINMLDDNELAGVVGHELTHIRNKDTRLLITSIIFVGILSTIMTVAVRLMVRSFLWGGTSSRSRDGKNNGASVVVILLVAVICSAILFLLKIDINIAHPVCHLTQTRIHGRCRWSRIVWQSLGVGVSVAKNLQQSRSDRYRP